jgi:hypothetical protein
MSKQVRDCDLDQMLLLSASLHDWVPEGHLARFVVEVVETRDLSRSGSPGRLKSLKSNSGKLRDAEKSKPTALIPDGLPLHVCMVSPSWRVALSAHELGWVRDG